jgi:16S rRNA (cytosine1402-N4)-methyltransferase
MPGHVPVLLSAVLESLHLETTHRLIDATLGGGGHTIAMLDRMPPDGRVLGIEADPRTLEATTKRLTSVTNRVTCVAGNFRNLSSLATANGFQPADVVLVDLGVSSMTIDDPERGFSFRFDGPLDMRFDPTTQDITAADLVNGWTHQQIADCLYGLGEEHLSRQIAGAIIDFRKKKPFERTSELAEVVASVKKVRGKIHPATQTFQALRLAVNDELGAILELLPQLLTVLRPGGQAAIITFHSLEDRIVKRFLQAEAKKGTIELQPKKPIQPTRQEMLDNPRSRSAKLRIFTTTS